MGKNRKVKEMMITFVITGAIIGCIIGWTTRPGFTDGRKLTLSETFFPGADYWGEPDSIHGLAISGGKVHLVVELFLEDSLVMELCIQALRVGN